MTPPPARRLSLFTDGACAGNPGPGGWAFVLRESGREDIVESGGQPATTNNRMELTAAIEGLRRIGEPSEVELVSDSEYLVKGLSLWLPGWKRKGWRGTTGPVKNQDLWKELDCLAELHRVSPAWVRGHSDHPENALCDRLAVAAIKQMEDGGRGSRRF